MPKLLRRVLRILPGGCNALQDCACGDDGQSLVELALVLPVFFMLMFGFINFCLIMFGLCNVSFACRQADRYACVHSSTSLSPATQSVVDGMVAPYVFRFPGNTYNDTLSYGAGGNVVGGTATVNVTIKYNIVIIFFSLQPVTLSSTASGAIVQ